MKSLTKNNLEFIKGGEVDCTKKIQKALNDLEKESFSLKYLFVPRPDFAHEIATRTDRCYIRSNSKHV